MGRWAHLDTDEERMPDGMRRVAYDADTQVYSYRDAKGHLWEGAPGCQYGKVFRVRSAQDTAPLPSFTATGHRQEKDLPPLSDDVKSFLGKKDKADSDSDDDLNEKKGLAWEKYLPKGMSRGNTLRETIRNRLDDMFDERIQSFSDDSPPAPLSSTMSRRKTLPINRKPVSRSNTEKSLASISRSNTERSDRSTTPLLKTDNAKTKAREKSQDKENLPRRAHTEKAPPKVPRKPVPEYKNEKSDKRVMRMTVSPLALFQLALEKPPSSQRKSRRDGPRLPKELQRRGTV